MFECSYQIRCGEERLMSKVVVSPLLSLHYLNGLWAGTALGLLCLGTPAIAQETPEVLPAPVAAAANPIYFARPLRLANVSTPNNWQFRASEYLFTIDIPADASQPLEKVVFAQIEGADYPRYSIRNTHAFAEGDRHTPLTLSQVENDTDERTVTVVFDPPIEPGRQITVALKAHHNPRGGIYLYQVTASPPGISGPGQRVGLGRLQFYERESIGRGRFGIR